MLPSPDHPNIIDVDVGFTDEVVGGMDGVCQEKTTNLQEWVTKGESLPHVLHERFDIDDSSDLRAINTSISRKQQGEQQPIQQQMENRDNR